MKRRIALALAAMLVLSAVFTTYATTTNGAQVSGNEGAAEESSPDDETVSGDQGVRDISDISGNEGEEEEDFWAMQSELGAVGQVDVVITSALILERDISFTLSLADAQGRIRTQSMAAGGVTEESRVSFSSLADGQYVLTVSAPGFATYRQNLTVDGNACTVWLATGLLGGMNYRKGAAHPGVLLIGDVDGDGAVNTADGVKLVDTIDSGKSFGLEDLNKDGMVNLVDLEYFARGYRGAEDTQAAVEYFVPAAVIRAAVDEKGTIVEGDLQRLLADQEGVTLKPKAGGTISEANPVLIEFDFAEGSASRTDGILIETGAENSVERAVIKVAYVDEDGAEDEIEVPVEAGVHHLLKQSDAYADVDENGTIRLHLGGQVALKKVTFTITGTKKNTNLAEISKVEFVNGMENRIPEPDMNQPKNLSAAAGNKEIRLSWGAEVNVTGYEVLICEGKFGGGGRQEVLKAGTNSVVIKSFGGKELVNYQEYQMKVQSVNGAWRSGYMEGEIATAVPLPSGKPDKPDNVSATGKYRSIVVSWKDMKDTVSYNLYYKESGASEYQKIEGITENRYIIENLKDLTEYTVYVTGVNEFGESGPSLLAAASTTDLNPAVMTKYNLINVGNEGEKGAHIISASMSATMVNSPLDTEAKTAWGTVDHDASSYYQINSWDNGGYNYMTLANGLTYEFDQAYKMDTIAFHNATSEHTGLRYAKVRYWDAEGKQIDAGGVSLLQKQDAQNRTYYVIKLSQPIEAKKIQFGLANASASGSITVSEVYFYYYDTLMDEIMALYEDDLHTVLKKDVTQDTIDALRVKINTIDPVSGEYHPDLQLLERELQTAEAILHDAKLNDSVRIYNGITSSDASRGFGGLNAWQPLGVTAAAQEEIMVYVGHNAKKTGDAASLQLIATQYHAESGTVAKVVTNLKVGPNKVTVPKIWTTTGVESGGALYVQYTGSNASDQYAVRVSGGVQVPRLDLYNVTDRQERLARAVSYVQQLKTYVAQMQANHDSFHKNSGNSQVAYEYDSLNCVLGATDILLDTMMLSLPASQVLSGAGSGTEEEQAARIVNSMDAMEDMMYLFYQHKGLNRNAEKEIDQVPKMHLNIRYQRMFSGAFMYAAGNHIGIEWGSAPGMMTSVPVVSDEAGRYQSGRYFGWGIAHEIGHCINQGTYAVAEVTNNYFSVLAQAKDTNDSVRFQYAKVYDKVTSGTTGSASNVFTQLGMYWQLHLAYDKGYNFKTYEDYEKQLGNLFFARVDTYARTASRAPAPGGVKLALSGSRDQDLMRLSCAAAEKNILEFFERWGMVPDDDTVKYAEQFEKETRAIYYGNDEARVYSLNGSGSSLGTEGAVPGVGSVTAAVNRSRANQVDFTLSSILPADDVLGYEITRCMISEGETQKEAVGFVTGNTFSDTVVVNNRVVWYEITVIDKYLNRSAVKVIDPIKIEHDGSLDKSFWTVGTNGLAADSSVKEEASEQLPCAPEMENVAAKVIDNQTGDAYVAAVEGSAEIILNFNKTFTVTGLKYTSVAADGGYEVYACVNNVWIQVAKGESFSQTKSDTIYFGNEDGKYVSTYEATGVKLVFTAGKGSQISVDELDVLGVTGDNVDFRRTDNPSSTGTAPVIGTLAADYKYGTKDSDVIPKGSIVFTGAYKGSPAYNVVILYDQNGNIVGGTNAEGELKAQQIILADVPDTGMIQNVSDGTWIYWIEPGQQVDLSGITKVRAELYRVNNALTNEGQRLVSDSLFETMPGTLPEIEINGNN